MTPSPHPADPAGPNRAAAHGLSHVPHPQTDAALPAPLLDVLVIGAGIAGLTAARVLDAAGQSVLVLDKARGVGGRMATRRIDTPEGTAVFDHGAQFFTARGKAFRAQVERWRADGAAHTWCHGFATQDGATVDGHPRYRGAPSMTGPAKALSDGLALQLRTRVAALRREHGAWRVEAEDGRRWQARSLVLTPPVPQALALLDAGAVTLPRPARQLLEAVDYDPCLALLAALDGPAGVPPPGGVVLAGEPLSVVVDNQRKGISALPALTLHATPEWSREHFDAAPEWVRDVLLEAAAPWLGSARVTAWQLHRWRYSLSLHRHPESHLLVLGPPPVAFAGDGFGGALVEGAVESGTKAAAALLPLLEAQ